MMQRACSVLRLSMIFIFLNLLQLIVFSHCSYRIEEIVLLILSSVTLFLSVLCSVAIMVRWKLYFFRILFSGLLATNYLVLLLLIVYRKILGSNLEIHFLVENFQRVLPTITQSFGSKKVLIGWMVVTIIFIFYYFCAAAALRSVERFQISGMASVVVVLMVVVAHSIVPFNLLLFVQGFSINHAQGKDAIHMNKSVDSINLSGENVVILQMESVGSAYLAPSLSKDEVTVKMPYLSSIKDGVFFPFHWSNGTPTDRAKASLLCGVTYHQGTSLAEHPEDIQVSCLPEILSKGGYRTLFAKAHPDPNFQNDEEFMRTIGFQEYHAADFMHEGDLKNGWGYEDCVFYERLFEYLKKQEINKTSYLMYVEVSSNNHWPWHLFGKYSYLHEQEVDPYVNSELQQSYCATEFVEKLYEFNGLEKTHLFITSDHGPSTSVIPMINLNYFVPFIYIPPLERRVEFAVGKVDVEQHFSHADVLPTIIELLSDEQQDNSFVFAIRKQDVGYNASVSDYYEDCQILTQNGGTRIAVIRDNMEYVFVPSEENVYVFDLTEGVDAYDGPEIISTVSFDQFVKKYFCNRYKQITLAAG